MSGSTSQLASLAWRESRSTRRRLLLYMSSISLGVAALVAIDSFAANVVRSIREQARQLLGGDVAFSARGAGWLPAADSALDSLTRAGIPMARQVSFLSMVAASRTGNTRLSQVRAVSPTFPLYGSVQTEPKGAWSELGRGGGAVVDPSLLIALDAGLGDTLQLGYSKVVVRGTLVAVPGDASFSSTVGPRVFISESDVAATRLLTFGSRADYDAFIRLPDGVDADQWLEPQRARWRNAEVRTRTVSQREESLTEAIDQLADFLGVVGLVALLLGGIGVASGVNAWVARKIDIVAVLRCLGATSRQVLAIYATQAALMGLMGAAIGAALGVAIQFALPSAIGDVLPVDVQVQLEPRPILAGLGLGVWISLAFALRPLIALRRVSPLQALRRNVGRPPRQGIDWLHALVNLFIAATVVGIAATRAQGWRQLIAFSVAIAAVIALLWLSGSALSAIARQSLRARWPYVIRQGIANLYRPANQTRSVVLSLGFGAFLVTTLFLVQSNLLKQFQITSETSAGNLLFFDVQPDQVDGVERAVRAENRTVVERTPIVIMRVAEVNGRPVPTRRQLDSVRTPDSASATRRGPRGAPGDRGWALRREYRSTYRNALGRSEKIILGKWFGETPAPAGAPEGEVSLEASVAENMGVSIGDVVTWNVQGVLVKTRVTSLREVNWARFETNFFAVFPPSTLANVSKTFVVLADAPGASSAAVQRAVVRQYPNIAALDLQTVRAAIETISQRASITIRFLALFSLAMAIPVLFTAVAATRRDRLRESVLLKTLGATRRQIGRILLAEYSLLGLLGSATGMLLSIGAAFALMKWVFERPFSLALPQAVGIALAMLSLAVGIGILSSREVFRETAMSALREV